MNNAKRTVFIDEVWGNECREKIESASNHSNFDIVIMADILYHCEDFSELVRTIESSYSSGGTDIIICFEKRRRDMKDFFDLIGQNKELSLVKVHVYSVVGPVHVDCEASAEVKFYIHHYRYKK